MKTLTPLLILAVLATGCTTLSNEDVVVKRVERLASIATPLVIKAKPEWRQGFVTAQIALEELSRDETADMDDVVNIINRLPQDQLQDAEARLYVQIGAEAVLILVDSAFGNRAIDLEQAGSARPIAAALARGISTGLN
jgi:hypothetical protein